MPGSTFSSGGGGVSASAVASGINQASDIDTLIQRVGEIKTALSELVLTTPIPELRPVVKGSAGAGVSSGPIASPGPGKALLIKIAGWYDKPPLNATLKITGADGEIYLDIPVTASGAGVISTNRLPVGVGATVTLSGGGDGVIASLNVGVASVVV